MTGRRWLELRVRHDGDEESGLAPEILVELGARGVVEDGDVFVAWFEEPHHPEAFVARARERLVRDAGIAVEGISWGWQEHEDWAESWKRGLGPRRITRRIVVHPSWHVPDDLRPDDVVIVLDPGMAFGTAEHGTTRGCLRLLDGTVEPGDRVLDVGAGSGILSIAAAGLGAEEVVAVEGDHLAAEALVANLEANGVGDGMRLVTAWVTAEELAGMGLFDVVVANIETGLLAPLLPGLAAAVADDGHLVLSGILEHEWSELAAAVADLGWTPDRTDEDGEWRSGRFVRGSGSWHPAGQAG